jgi:hypothetical protein
MSAMLTADQQATLRTAAFGAVTLVSIASGPLDQDRRWADARGLLHEDVYPAARRVARLLILLYAQKLDVITALTIQHVLHQDGRTLLRLGSRPIVLPAPLDDLVTRLAAGRATCGRSLLALPSPGCSPGTGLGARSPRTRSPSGSTPSGSARSRAMLGIHAHVAIQWQKISAGDWTAYAADVSRRGGAARFVTSRNQGSAVTLRRPGARPRCKVADRRTSRR